MTNEDGFEDISFGPGSGVDVSPEEVRASLGELESENPYADVALEEPEEEEEGGEEESEEVEEEGDDADPDEVDGEKEEGGEKETDSEEGEASVFDDFFNGQASEGTPEIDYASVAKELGLEADSKDSLVEQINQLKQAKGGGETPKFANEKVNNLFQKAMELEKAGEDPLAVFKTSSEVDTIEAEIKSAEEFIESFKSKQRSYRLEDKEDILRSYYTEILGIPQEQAVQHIQDLKDQGDHRLIGEANRYALEMVDRLGNVVEKKRGKVSDIRDRQKKVEIELTEKQAKRKEEVTKAISEFSDPHHKGFGRITQDAARRAFETELTPAALPKGLLELFFYEDGKFSPQKALQNMNRVLNSDNKLKYVLEEAQRGNFKKKVNYRKNGGVREKVTSKKKPKDDGFDSIHMPSPIRARRQ